MKKNLKRRDFMVQASTALMGAGWAAKAGFGRPTSPVETSRVVEVYHPRAVMGERKVNKDLVRQMVQEGLGRLTGKKQPWAEFLDRGDRVGLKINTLGKPLLYTHHELVQVMIEELTAFGIKENNIIVWDRWQPHMTAVRFVLNTSDKGVRCYGTEGGGAAAKRLDPDVAYVSEFDNPEEREGGTSSLYSSIFTKECDKVINLAVLKDHGLSGYTMCLKNLAFGLCNNNNRFHKAPHIGPFIADFCAQPMVRKKVVLHLIDGLEACYDRGPAPDNARFLFSPKKIWFGTDPVALDAVGYRVIDTQRTEKGLPPLKQSMSFENVPRPVDQIDLAAAKGLGICDLERIKIDRSSL
jgi:uncharacterized protein (DUF362 family)